MQRFSTSCVANKVKRPVSAHPSSPSCFPPWMRRWFLLTTRRWRASSAWKWCDPWLRPLALWGSLAEFTPGSSCRKDQTVQLELGQFGDVWELRTKNASGIWNSFYMFCVIFCMVLILGDVEQVQRRSIQAGWIPLESFACCHCLSWPRKTCGGWARCGSTRSFFFFWSTVGNVWLFSW